MQAQALQLLLLLQPIRFTALFKRPLVSPLSPSPSAAPSASLSASIVFCSGSGSSRLSRKKGLFLLSSGAIKPTRPRPSAGRDIHPYPSSSSCSFSSFPVSLSRGFPSPRPLLLLPLHSPIVRQRRPLSVSSSSSSSSSKGSAVDTAGTLATATTTTTMAAPTQEWLVVVPDFEGALDKRMAVREKHLEGVKPKVQGGKISLGGSTLVAPTQEGQMPQMNGSVLIAAADTEAAVREMLEHDVYVKSGVWDWDKVQITPIKIAVRK